ncbi:hypothetical protein BV25DRAFT_1187888 [Artomyces pyxidatus]|uniref:Uncharacterized protein n=1 Tax=Artomyces pyxidatus TaxID=48021 RepID=A0ACB8SQV9_9AGAM|nr:hypothetical protein BV25DRAFT_1187888 [Artomyces pyxidatus]
MRSPCSLYSGAKSSIKCGATRLPVSSAAIYSQASKQALHPITAFTMDNHASPVIPPAPFSVSSDGTVDDVASLPIDSGPSPHAALGTGEKLIDFILPDTSRW